MNRALTTEIAAVRKFSWYVASLLICKPVAARNMTMLMVAAALVSAKRMRA